jgi:hypothetical protein
LTLDGALKMGAEQAWERDELFKDYKHIYTLGPEFNLLYLCEHGLKHDFLQLVYLHEVAGIIRFYKDRFDWQRFLRLTEESGIKRVVYFGLYFTKELLAGDVPEDVLKSLKPDRLSFGEKRFINEVLRAKKRKYSSYPVYLALHRGLIAKGRFIFLTILPPGMTFSAYFKRIGRLILP